MDKIDFVIPWVDGKKIIQMLLLMEIMSQDLGIGVI